MNRASIDIAERLLVEIAHMRLRSDPNHKAMLYQLGATILNVPREAVDILLEGFRKEPEVLADVICGWKEFHHGVVIWGMRTKEASASIATMVFKERLSRRFRDLSLAPERSALDLFTALLLGYMREDFLDSFRRDAVRNIGIGVSRGAKEADIRSALVGSLRRVRRYESHLTNDLTTLCFAADRVGISYHELYDVYIASLTEIAWKLGNRELFAA